ncbi:MAG: prepilin-type N-terminal cleavage/methylation domain-containing protein [Pseudohongiellaceae bacterium]
MTINRPDIAGFTIIEMIVAIVISAIMAIGIVSYIGDSVEGISASTRRSELGTAGRIALDRMAMELHNALPNSIRTTTAGGGGDQCIEFVPVRAATSYLDAPFTGGGSDTFDVVDFEPDQEGTSGGFAVIYPDDIDDIYDGENMTTSGFPDRGPIEEIDTIEDTGPSSDASTVTLVETHRFRRRSPYQRFFLVDEPVSFCVKDNKLYRYTNYGFYSVQTDEEEETGVCEVAMDDRCLPNYDAAPDKMLITHNINNAGLEAFTVSPQSLQRNALISFKFMFEDGNDAIEISHETLTRSVP